jgi:small GTP-binding protein
MSNLNYDDIIKISIVGDAGNGKTSLMRRFVENDFTENKSSTVGIDCGFKIINVNTKKNNKKNSSIDNENKETKSEDYHADLEDNTHETPLLNDYQNRKVKVKVWDTAGQEKFGDIIRSCYRDSDGVIITYDTTNHDSFLNLEKWIEKINNVINSDDIIIMVVGTKTDLINKRAVDESDIFNFIHSNNLKYIEVSSKESKNVKLLFEMMTKAIIEKDNFLGKDKRKENNAIRRVNLREKNKETKINNNWCNIA